MTVRVARFGGRRTNAQAVVDAAALGYLRRDWVTLDVTYGLHGRFWRSWRPDHLIASDLHHGDRVHVHDGRSQWVNAWDFTALPADVEADVVVLDGPYKLNGTPSGAGPASSDVDYGVDAPARWQDRHALINTGIVHCAHRARRVLLVKCMDQVCSGAVRWQQREFAATAEATGMRHVDTLHVSAPTAQPPTRPCSGCAGQGVVFAGDDDTIGDACDRCDGVGRIAVVQRHAEADHSSLLVFSWGRLPR